MESPVRIADALSVGREKKTLDFKGPMAWDEHDKKASCEIVKDVLAMANTGGGLIVIGVEETGQCFRPVGLARDQAASWETTRLNQFISRYADPPVNAELLKDEVDGSTYACIRVPEFPDVPHLCKKEFPGVLSRATFYIRSDDVNSVPISRASDMRALIERATRKRGDAIADLVREIVSHGVAPPEMAVEEKFQAQLDDALYRFHEKSQCAAKYDAWRELVAYPESFVADRVTDQHLMLALEHAEQDITGWPFVFVDRRDATARLVDGWEGHSAAGGYADCARETYWTLRNTGLFLHRDLLPEATSDLPRWVAEVVRNGELDRIEQRHIDLGLTIEGVALGIQCIGRLYEVLDLGDEAITVRYSITSTLGRVVIPSAPVVLPAPNGAAIAEVVVSRTESAQVWRASVPRLSAEMVAEILELFNWRDARTYQDQFASRAARVLGLALSR